MWKTSRTIWVALLASGLLLVCPSRGQTSSTASYRSGGAVIQAVSCTQAAVQAAIDLASAGDIVQIPAGACTWSTPASQTPAVQLYQKNLTLLGAGVGQTVITDGTGLGWNEVLLRIDGLAGPLLRVSGLSIIGQGTGHYDSFAAISVYGSSQAFRLDHLRFDNIAGRSIEVNGNTYGVVDHCDFIQPDGQGLIILDNRGTPPGSTGWTEPMSFGTARAVYIEDSTFTWGSENDSAIDCTNGGRYVFRHNIVSGVEVANHGMDSVPRSCLQMEIYANTFVPMAHTSYAAIKSRGGAALIFDNTLTGNYQVGLGITNYRSCCYAGAACTPNPDPPHGTCDGTNPLDGNTAPAAIYKGWPCKDQIGRGANQSAEPLYEWNNTLNGADMDFTVLNNWTGCVNPQPADHVQVNRDYYNDTPKPGYTPYVYPHPLTKELVLTGTPASQTLHLAWEVKTVLPVSTTWTIAYTGPTGTEPSPLTGLANAARAYTLSGLTNYAWYTVTLTAVGADPGLSDTVRLMPTDKLIYLPLVNR